MLCCVMLCYVSLPYWLIIIRGLPQCIFQSGPQNKILYLEIYIYIYFSFDFKHNFTMFYTNTFLGFFQFYQYNHLYFPSSRIPVSWNRFEMVFLKTSCLFSEKILDFVGTFINDVIRQRIETLESSSDRKNTNISLQ